MGKKTPRASPRQTPRARPAEEPTVIDASSALRVARRSGAGAAETNGDGECRRSDGRCTAGMNRPVSEVLDKLASLRRQTRVDAAEEQDHERAAKASRLAAVQAIADATRRSGVRSSSPHRSHGGSAGARAGRVSTTPAGVPLRKALGLPSDAPRLSDNTALVLIDCQITYTEGPMRLHNVEAAVAECARLLRMARKAGATIVHIAHHAGSGTLYDVEGRSGAIIDDVAPLPGERAIIKSVPSSFHGTDLEEYLDSRGVKNLVLAGFMTHCCVSSTARHAFNLQKYDKVAVVAAATATRTLPDARDDGAIVDPEDMQQATLAGIAELHAAVVPTARDVPW